MVNVQTGSTSTKAMVVSCLRLCFPASKGTRMRHESHGGCVVFESAALVRGDTFDKKVRTRNSF